MTISLKQYLLLLALAAAASTLIAQANGPEPRYSLTIDPSKPSIGDLVVVELKVGGFSASSSSVSELRPDSGLSVESESIRPFVSVTKEGSGHISGSVFRFEMRVLGAGIRKIEMLTVAASEGKLELGPLVVCDVPGEGSADTSQRSSAWRWVVPPEALRYEAFEARLEPSGRDGAFGQQADAAFAAPEGASFEPSGRLSWTVIALEEGELFLPGVSLGKDGEFGHANPTKVSIEALPAAIASTRAIGEFSISIAGPEPAVVSAGSPLSFRLILSGTGNLPALVLPEPIIRLDGSILPRGAWTATRTDDSRADRGSYSGTASLTVEIISSKPGLLTLRFPPVPVIDPLRSADRKADRDGVSSLDATVREVRITKGISAATRRPEASVEWGSGLEGAAALWSRGEKGRALAELYRSLREAPPLSRRARTARAAALLRSSELGTGMPLLDALLPWQYFGALAFIVASIGLGLFISARKRRRRAGWSSLTATLTVILALSVLGFISAAERKQNYAVLWAEELRTVPSSKSELRISVLRGTTARIRGSFGAYAGVILADGVEGWTPRDTLFPY